MNTELAIGEIGVIDGVKVECCEDTLSSNACEDCAFKNHSSCEVFYRCAAFDRSDHTNVYFKRVD